MNLFDTLAGSLLGNTPYTLIGTLVKHRGIAINNKYRVVLPNIGNIRGSDLSVLCRSVEMPGKNITTTPRRTAMREIEIPTGYNLVGVNMVFTETMKSTVKEYFDAWMNAIVDPRTHTVAYYKDVARDVHIIRQGRSGVAQAASTLVDAIPKTISAATLTAAGQMGPVEYTVEFVYRDVIEALA
jgi:hypothetical protein